MNKDRTVKFLAYEGKVSVICSKTTDLIEYVRNLHDLTPTTTAALGRFVTISGMMGHTEIKEDEDSLTMQLNGKGLTGSLVSVVEKENNQVFLKAYISNPKVELPLKSNGKIDVGGAVGNSGYLNIIKENGITDKGYNGLVPLVSGEIAEDFASYFAQSKQTPTVLALGVLVNKDGVKEAGGYMINLMPDATENEISKIENAISKAPSISEMLDNGILLEEIAKVITGDENIEIIEDNLVIGYRCDCSKEKFEKGLISLGKKEIENIIVEEGVAETKCHFCNKTYKFTKEELEALIKE
jgi:molecular chaperone Hsp33